MSNNKQSESGFTLLEVIIVIGVLSIGILGVAVMQYTSTGSNAKAYRLTEATNIGIDAIERILLMNPTDPVLNTPRNSSRMGLPVGANGGVVTQINEVATGFINQTEDYDVWFIGTPLNDPVTITQVGIDFRLYVVWTEEARMKTVEFNFVKMI